VRIVVVGPRVQADQGDTVRTDGRRKHRLHLKVTLPGECRDRHRVVAGVLAVASTDVGGGESIQMIARSSPYRPANAENGATLTEHSPPRVAIRAELSWRMILRARASCSMTIVLASTPSRSARPSSVIVTGTVRVGPSCGGRTAWRTAEPTAYPRLATSNGKSEAHSCTLGVPPPATVARSGGGRHRGMPRWSGSWDVPYLGQDRNSQESSVLIVVASLGDLVESSANLVVCPWCLYSVPSFRPLWWDTRVATGHRRTLPGDFW
jgi:hypothetical protein